MALVRGARRDTNGNTRFVCAFGPRENVVVRAAHGVLDARLVNSAHLAVDNAAHTELLKRGDGSARGGLISNEGDSARESLKAAQDSGRTPIARVKLLASDGKAAAPIGVRFVGDDAAHDGVLEMHVEVHHARHESRLFEVHDFFVGVNALEQGRLTYLDDLPVAHQNRTIKDGI